MGKVDQGVFNHWMLAHHFQRPLECIGFGATGKQVRDLLHVDDLLDLLDQQVASPQLWDGVVANVGGGRDCSLSLRQSTELCVQITGNRVPIDSAERTRPGDVRIYVSDYSRLLGLTQWRPRRAARDILADIHAWICGHEAILRQSL